jgi:uncharacterized protein DUF6178
LADGVALLRLGRSDRAAARARLRELAPEEIASLCQELRPEARTEFLMLLDRPEAVVPLLPEAELVHTVRAGGMSEAAWLLEIATPEQRVACFDLDCWNGQALVVPRVQEWLDALVEAGRPTLVKALGEIDLELLILALRAETRIAVVAKEDIPPDGWFSPDGVVYFGVQSDQSPHRVKEIAESLAADEPALYWRLVYGALFESPAECEEEALHWRTVRLSDLGFPDREQAMRVYRTLAPERVTDWVPPSGSSELVAAISLPRQLRGSLLGEALLKLPERQAADVLGYVLGVANSLAVADGLSLSEPESVPRALEKAVRGIDAGLRDLARSRNQAPERILERTSPLDLFRVAATADPSLRARAHPEEDRDDAADDLDADLDADLDPDGD